MEAFKAGSGMEGSELSLLVAGAGCVAILLCAAWVLTSAYRGWAKGRVGGDTLSIVAIKVVLLIVLFFWVFLS
ncbi:TIGR03758 family integrating conjugative element protein [Kushneria indalinina]|uniref:TIGR03758 family integrating conjugative element protein n=1 Tax=Kushneria indalinina TaxID=184067 RepID=UPI000E28674A